MQTLSYFLGANSSHGFYSLFNELYNPDEDWTMYIIKGGPGTGKSSLMKKIATEAENRKLKTERIYCSSDPSSLDAVIIPEIKTAIADGTKPHTIEPVYPGVVEQIINLGEYWNTTKLENNKAKIKETTQFNSYYHKKCVKFLNACSIIEKEINFEIEKCFLKEKADRFIKRYCEQLYSTDNDSNISQKRFLSAITHKGISVNYSSLFDTCEDILIIKDKNTFISNYILNAIYKTAELKNIDKTVCVCPLNPEKIEHLIFPCIKKGIFTANSYHPALNNKYKTMRSERFLDKDCYDEIKNKLTFLNKAKMELIGESVNCLKKAKLTHDILESYYISAMDFSRINDLSEKLINEIFR